jgi:arabinan endo-1,5-alpha-L-arabinosidase
MMHRFLTVLTLGTSFILLFLAMTLQPVNAANTDRIPALLQTQAATPAATLQPSILPLTGVTSPVHDPTLVKDGNMYYVVSTGPGISIHCSEDMLSWDTCGKVFPFPPAWIYKAVPNVGDLWAPDLIYWNGLYHLYYAASSFGSNHSAIGLATNTTLDQGSKAYKWVDQGMVISSEVTDNFNAIDPNLVIDQNKQPWLVFGSFWSGIKMRKIDAATGKLDPTDATLYSLAGRPGNGPIEGAYIVYHGGYYYLFVSFDFCCRSVDSTYKIMVGRSDKIDGPYVDREGLPMITGGGSLIYAGDARWRGPGHNMVYVENGVDWLVYHAYDADMNGVPTLRIEALQWDSGGWPVSPSALLAAR